MKTISRSQVLLLHENFHYQVAGYMDTSTGSYDMQITAQALARGLTLITHNANEFSRVPNLTLKNRVI